MPIVFCNESKRRRRDDRVPLLRLFAHSIATRLAQDGWIGSTKFYGGRQLISHRDDFRDIAYVAKRIG